MKIALLLPLLLSAGLIQAAGAQGVAEVQVTPEALSLGVGQKQDLFVAAFDKQGNLLPTARFAFGSSDTSIARVSPEGTVVGLKPGLARIDVRAQERRVAVAVFVTAPGSGIPARAPRDSAAPAPAAAVNADFALSPPIFARPPNSIDTIRALVPSQGNRAVGDGLAWRSADTTVARVGPTGIVQTLGPGETDVIASGFGQERRTRVVVYRRAEIFFLSPRPASGPIQVPLDGNAAVTARAQAADSTPVPQAQVTWEVGDSAIATFDSGSGKVTAHRVGSTSLTARLSGFDPAIWVITVVPGDIALDRSRLGLEVGASAMLAIAFADSTGGALGTPQGVIWVSDRPAVATVGGDGLVSALAPGHATAMVRTPWGKTAWADVFVTGDVLLSSNRQGRGFGIYQLRAAAPDLLIPVLVDTAANLQAVWSPDRTRIAFSSNRLGTYDIYVMDADGRSARALTSDPGSESEPAWTPDGTRLVFSAARGGSSQIYSIRADGEDLRPLTATAGGNSAPTFSPDGRTIAFATARDGNHEIYLMDPDGGNQRRVTATPAREASPRFFPNGDLAWIADRGSRGSAIVRQPAGSLAAAPLFEEAATIVSFALSRDGTRVAYVTGRLASDAKASTQFRLLLRSLAPGAAAEAVRLGPAEQPVTPAF